MVLCDDIVGSFFLVSICLYDSRPYTGNMDNNSRWSLMSTLFIFLLLCSVCVLPVIAADKQNNVIEEGVHLLNFDTSATSFDP